MPLNSDAQTPNLKLGEWKVHLPYTNARSLVEAKDKIYIGTTESLFSYDLEDFSLATYTTVNGTSELGISAVAYCEPLDMLVVAYESGNIDILNEGNFSNISDIKRSNYLSGKRINHILILDKTLPITVVEDFDKLIKFSEKLNKLSQVM